MTGYLVQPRMFIEGYGSLSFAKNVCENIGKNKSKILKILIS